MPSRSEQQAARSLMEVKDIAYTHALRLIRTGQVTYEKHEGKYTFKEESK